MSWLEVALEIPSSLATVCEEMLENFGAVSVSFLDAGDEPLLEPKPGTTPLWDKIKIVGLFTENADLSFLKQLKSTLPALSFTVTPLADQEWTRTWLAHFRPMRFGKKLWISPTGYPEDIKDKDAIIVKLDPGLAFGTGTHPTTALCLEWLDSHPPIQQTVIDYGCGSGILGIAALKLGAKEVWAIDYDPQALLATKDNGIKNTIDQNIKIAAPKDFPITIKAQIIIANILAEPLISLAPTLQQHCELGGSIILSGLLENQSDAVQAAYTPWFSFKERILKDDWVLLEGIKMILGMVM